MRTDRANARRCAARRPCSKPRATPRRFRTRCLFAFAAAVAILPSRCARGWPGFLVLENEWLAPRVAPQSGAIAPHLRQAGADSISRAGRGLADNFRLVLRGADKTDKVILGRDQKLSGAVRRPAVGWTWPGTDR